MQEAYNACKYAFVSDYVRLFTLQQYGGLYLDVDFFVFRSFSPLLNNSAFAGYEGSKHSPIMMGVLASELNGRWVLEALQQYDNRRFLLANGTFDMTPNTSYFSKWMVSQGLILDGNEKDFHGLHIYPVDYFCPMQTSGEYFITQNTYCEHRGLNSWSDKTTWKDRLLQPMSPIWRKKLILLKRRLFD